jgi:hypothetical protein
VDPGRVARLLELTGAGMSPNRAALVAGMSVAKAYAIDREARGVAREARGVARGPARREAVAALMPELRLTPMRVGSEVGHAGGRRDNA